MLSRIEELEMCNGIDELPDLSEDYLLSIDQVIDFEKKGHIYLGKVALQEEVEIYRPYIQEIVHNECIKNANARKREDVYGKAFIQIMNLFLKNLQIRRFVMASRFAKIAAQLLRSKRIRLYYDCALFKEPGGGHTPVHIDPFVVDAQKIVTMWMPLCDITDEMGSLVFLSGSHMLEAREKPTERLLLEAGKRKLPEFTYGSMRAGDATFHSGWMIHSAPPNPSSVTREVMTVTYFSDPATITNPGENVFRQESLKKYFPGLSPGDEAITLLNPIVYTEEFSDY